MKCEFRAVDLPGLRCGVPRATHCVETPQAKEIYQHTC
jgi:hypothetical protein